MLEGVQSYGELRMLFVTVLTLACVARDPPEIVTPQVLTSL